MIGAQAYEVHVIHLNYTQVLKKKRKTRQIITDKQALKMQKWKRKGKKCKTNKNKTTGLNKRKEMKKKTDLDTQRGNNNNKNESIYFNVKQCTHNINELPVTM